MKKFLVAAFVVAGLLFPAAPANADPDPYLCTQCGWSLENCDQYGHNCEYGGGRCDHRPKES